MEDYEEVTILLDELDFSPHIASIISEMGLSQEVMRAFKRTSDVSTLCSTNIQLGLI